MSGGPFRPVVVLAGLFLGLRPVLALPPARVTIGPGWAWVREFFPPSGSREITQIIWTNPPAEVELDTLQVWNVRRPWPLQQWRWGQEVPAMPQNASEAPVRWQPADAPASPPDLNRLEIVLAEPLSHTMGHSLTYRLPGLIWNAFYRVIVRGIGPQSIEAVQVDLTGTLRVENPTGASFARAQVLLVGHDETRQPPPKPFGWVDLNPETPLADLWRQVTEVSPQVPFLFPLNVEVPISPYGQTEFTFARVIRKPAFITHVCDSEMIPAPTPKGGLPLRRMLWITNSPAMGLGFALPPGHADLFLGASRGAPHQSGWVQHTPFPGILSLDMGMVDSVRAARWQEGEQPLPEGGAQSEHVIQVFNQLDSPVRIQIKERPVTPRPWSLIRSSRPCTQSTGLLLFDLSLEPQSSQAIRYRLRLASAPAADSTANSPP